MSEISRCDAAHLLLLQKHAGAGANLARNALPRLVVCHHRLLQLILGLEKINTEAIGQSTKTIISQIPS